MIIQALFVIIPYIVQIIVGRPEKHEITEDKEMTAFGNSNGCNVDISDNNNAMKQFYPPTPAWMIQKSEEWDIIYEQCPGLFH